MNATQLTQLAKDADLNSLMSVTDNGDELIEKFKKAWPVVRPVLNAIKSVTGPAIDRIIDEVIELGDAVAGSASGDIAQKIKKFCEKWQTVRAIISGIAAVIPGRLGIVIRAFIKNLDILCCDYGVC